MDSLFPLLSAPVPDRDRPRMRCFSCRSSQERFSSSGMDREGGGQHFFYVTRQFALCPINRPSLDRCVLLLAHPRRAGDRGLSTRTRAGASNDKRGGMRVSPLSSLPPLSSSLLELGR